MHPRFKTSWIDSDERKAEVWELVRNEIRKLDSQGQPNVQGATSSTQKKPTKPGTGDVDYFFPKEDEELDNMRYLEAYIAQPLGDLSELKRFPIIEKLFRKFNTLMPSSASVEVS